MSASLGRVKSPKSGVRPVRTNAGCSMGRDETGALDGDDGNRAGLTTGKEGGKEGGKEETAAVVDKKEEDEMEEKGSEKARGRGECNFNSCSC